MKATTPPSVLRQLFSNQLWETIAFVAKAGFMVLLTPWMMKVWGPSGYGEFALASSTFVLLSIADLGIRARTRLALCGSEQHNRSNWLAVVCHSLSTFGFIGALTILLSFALAWSGALSHLFAIPARDKFLLPLTTLFSLLVMASGLLLEPLIAVGQIGKVKLATAAGWVASLAAVALVLALNGTVTTASVVWLGCLILANLTLFLAHLDIFDECGKMTIKVSLRGMMTTLKESFWFNLCTGTWCAKTYGTTFLVAAIDGPATAGIFFILLRLSEIISGLGAISSDVSLGELAQVRSIRDQRRSFASSYTWAVILCCHLALTIGFGSREFLRMWLSAVPAPSNLVGVLIAAMGLASAFNRTVTYAAMATGKAKNAALAGLLETACYLLLVALTASRSASLLLQLGVASASMLTLLPLARTLSHRLGCSSVELWIRPLKAVLPPLVISALIQSAAFASGSSILKSLAVLSAGILCLMNLISYTRKSSVPTNVSPPRDASLARSVLCSTHSSLSV
jgi:O-antigen/teichoic acid export membrane protein